MTKLDPSKTLAEQADPVYAKEKAQQDPDVAGHSETARQKLADKDNTLSRDEVDEAIDANEAEKAQPEDGEDNANTDESVDAGGVPAEQASLAKEINKEA